MKNRYSRCKSETAVQTAVERDCEKAVSNNRIDLVDWYVFTGNRRIDEIRDTAGIYGL